MSGRAILSMVLGLSLCGTAYAQTPQQKTAEASGIFAELCAKSLPGMSGLEGKVRKITERAYANSGGVDQPGIYVQGGSITTGLGFGVGTPNWKGSDGKKFCQTSVLNINRTKAIDEIFAAFEAAKPASIKVTAVDPTPKGMLAAWQVSGSKSGMMLEVTREPRTGVRFRLAWD